MLNLAKSIFRIAKTIILIFLLFCLVMFLVNNRDVLSLSLSPLPFKIETRVFVVMILFFVLGFLFAILACCKSLVAAFFLQIFDRRKIKKLQKQVDKKN
jgi:uncharacterized membrane protein